MMVWELQCFNTNVSWHSTVLKVFLLAGVAVRFLQSNYAVEEGETTRVCANLVGTTEIAVTVRVEISPLDVECRRHRMVIIVMS